MNANGNMVLLDGDYIKEQNFASVDIEKGVELVKGLRL